MSSSDLVCKTCGKFFTKSFNLKRHIKSVHENENFEFFSCNFCDKKMKRKHDLLRHISTLHDVEGDNNQEETVSLARKPSLKENRASRKNSIPCITIPESDQEGHDSKEVSPEDGSKMLERFLVDLCKEVELASEPKEDSVVNQESPHSQHNDNSVSMCDESAATKDDNGESFDDEAMEQDCNSSNTFNVGTAAEKVKPVGDDKKKTALKENYGTYINCIECETNYRNIQSLRDHLSSEHDLNMDKVEFHFPNMDAFKKWKHDLERQDMSSYILRCGFKRTKKDTRNDYLCHRSGRNHHKIVGVRRRMTKSTGSVKLGIVCTSVIRCIERPDGVIVHYYPHHYGHGKEISFVHLTPEEQDAINENVSKGIPFENLLDELKDTQSSTDHFQLNLIKKKDARFISNAYAADEYHPGVGEFESVDRWVRQCCKMENSPILFYQPDGTKKGKNKFLLIIMTEFQKQILMSAAKQVVCVDSMYWKRRGGIYLSVLTVMDDNNIAFPVAFCLSNKVEKYVMLQFFESVKESTGPLSFSYFMSDTEEFVYEAWQEVMDNESHWLWCMWSVENRVKLQLKVFRGNVAKKAEAYKTMRTLLECQNVNLFESMFKNYIEALKADPSSRALGDSINQRYGKHVQLWAYCYRKEIPLSTNIHLEVLHRVFQFCCREGRKKRLDKFLFVVMKLVRYKMLDRLFNILDDEKTELAVEAIKACHDEGLEVTSRRITSLSDKMWFIEAEEDEQNIYVMKEFETCPEHCSLRCKDCDICVHVYSCSCIDSLINANMCPHIHAVVWKFLTPHFTPPPSPVADDIEEQENRDISVSPDKCSELRDEILNRSHEVCKVVKESNLPKEALTGILRSLNHCIDISKGKVVDELATNHVQNVLSVVLPDNCPENTQYVLVLSNNERAELVPTTT